MTPSIVNLQNQYTVIIIVTLGLDNYLDGYANAMMIRGICSSIILNLTICNDILLWIFCVIIELNLIRLAVAKAQKVWSALVGAQASL